MCVRLTKCRNGAIAVICVVLMKVFPLLVLPRVKLLAPLSLSLFFFFFLIGAICRELIQKINPNE